MCITVTHQWVLYCTFVRCECEYFATIAALLWRLLSRGAVFIFYFGSLSILDHFFLKAVQNDKSLESLVLILPFSSQQGGAAPFNLWTNGEFASVAAFNQRVTHSALHSHGCCVAACRREGAVLWNEMMSCCTSADPKYCFWRPSLKGTAGLSARGPWACTVC